MSRLFYLPFVIRIGIFVSDTKGSSFVISRSSVFRSRVKGGRTDLFSESWALLSYVTD